MSQARSRSLTTGLCAINADYQTSPSLVHSSPSRQVEAYQDLIIISSIQIETNTMRYRG